MFTTALTILTSAILAGKSMGQPSGVVTPPPGVAPGGPPPGATTGGPPPGVGGPPPGVGGPPPGVVPGGHAPAALDPMVLERIEDEYDRCNSEIIDVHLHDAAWFQNADPLLAEMDQSHISRGLMLSVYGPIANPFSGDPNEVTDAIIQGSKGRIFGLASLNTTIPDWENHGGEELERLATYLAKKPGFVGGKVAAPHTCLPLNSSITRQVVQTIAASPSPVLFTHIGTTPFCGPMGAAIFGRPACCAPEYVDPTYMEDLIQEYTNTSFILVHAGADFLPPTGENFYDGEMVDKSIALAAKYDNVYLEISAFLRQDGNGTDVYMNGSKILQKIADAGLASKTIYGSDVNHGPHAMAPYLATTLEKLIEAGFNDEERCMIFAGNAIKVFGLELQDGESQQQPPIEEEAGEEDEEDLEEQEDERPDPVDYISSASGQGMITFAAALLASSAAAFL